MARYRNNRQRKSQPQSAALAPSGFNNLPPEIFERIIKETSRNDLSSLSRCSRGLYWATSDVLYSRAFEDLVAKEGSIEDAVACVFIHAVRHDAKNLIQWLMFREHGSRLRGEFPWMNGFTYLHYALLQDAPKVAIQLLKHGSNLDEDAALYPDLKSLYVAIARPLSNTLGALDGPLRIACSYALPRMTEYLLIRGADPNAYSSFGCAAIHTAVRQRPQWGRFELFSLLNQIGEKTSPQSAKRRWNDKKTEEEAFPKNTPKEKSESNPWETKVLLTVKVLLSFGADCNLPTRNTRIHRCNHKCWKSMSCAPIAQRVLHIAAASGYSQVVSTLVAGKADVFEADGQGNLPVVHAMAQDHEEIASSLLRRMKSLSRKRTHGTNPIVCTLTKSTALHMACRFGHYNVVSDLLRKGASVDLLDSRRRTPLHEALGQCAPDLEDRLVETLYQLSEGGACKEAIDRGGIRAADMGENHPLGGVRALFEYATRARYDWQRLTESQGGGELNYGYVPPPHSSWFVSDEPEFPPPISHEMALIKAPVWVKKESFPELKKPESQNTVDPTPDQQTSTQSLPKAVEHLDTVEGVESTEIAEEIEKKQQKKGGRKKWTRVSLE
ncbi:ankyrin repeat-containing domain protein [Trichoderma chlorosporum]